MQKKSILFFNSKKCSGCLLCEMACSLKHFGVTGRENSYLRIVTNNTAKTSLALLSSDDIVSSLCSSCKACIQICNLEALKIVSIESLGEFLKGEEATWMAVPAYRPN